jgi:hypothetical protein
VRTARKSGKSVCRSTTRWAASRLRVRTTVGSGFTGASEVSLTSVKAVVGTSAVDARCSASRSRSMRLIRERHHFKVFGFRACFLANTAHVKPER